MEESSKATWTDNALWFINKHTLYCDTNFICKRKGDDV